MVGHRYNITAVGLNFGTASFFSVLGAVVIEDDVSAGGTRVVAETIVVDQAYIVFRMPPYVRRLGSLPRKAASCYKHVHYVLNAVPVNSVVPDCTHQFRGHPDDEPFETPCDLQISGQEAGFRASGRSGFRAHHVHVRACALPVRNLQFFPARGLR